MVKKKKSEKTIESEKNIKNEEKSEEKEAVEELSIHELESMIKAEKDRSLRLSAEFENYKKRSAKENQEFKRFANETLFKQLFSVEITLKELLIPLKKAQKIKAFLRVSS